MPRPGPRRAERDKGQSRAGGRAGVQTLRAAPLLCGLLLVALALAGCGGNGGRQLPPEWRGRDVAEPGWASARLQPGWGLGLEYAWSSGKEVQWDWVVNGSAPLHYRVVRVENGRAQTIQSMFANESAAGFTVIQSGQHQLLWRNEGFLDSFFWYKVPEGGLVRSYSPTEGPDCTFLLGAPC
jgi:hypothetical protein